MRAVVAIKIISVRSSVLSSLSSWWTPAVRMGLSISVATGLYGISFGALAVAAGLTVGQAMALSLLMFTGGSQFAFIGVLAGGGAASAAVGAATLLGVRNAVYGMQMNRLLAPTGWRKWLAAHVTVDESAATAVGQSAPDEQRRGSPSASPSHAPSSVNTFHSRNTPKPAVQKPRCCSSGALWPTAVAADSSTVTCAASHLRQPVGANRRFICIP